MGYDTPSNRAVAKRVREIDQRHINRIKSISETNGYDIATPLEAMTMRHREVVGGSGFAAATVQDLGFEPTMGATPNQSGSGMSGGGMSGGSTTTDRPIGGGMSGGGMSGGGMSGGGMSGGGMSGGALLTLQDMHKMTGQPPPTRQKKITQKASPHKDQQVPEPARGPMINGPVGAGKPRSRAPTARNELVRQVMKEQKMTLPQASKYIKERGLYTGA
jgi:hypothetical protein